MVGGLRLALTAVGALALGVAAGAVLDPQGLATAAANAHEGAAWWLMVAWTWMVAIDTRPIGESPGLSLVLGGAGILTVLLVMLIVRGPPAAPQESPARILHTRRETPPPAEAKAPVYRGPRDEEYLRGRLAGTRVPAEKLDDVLDYVTAAGMARPRILRSLPNLLRVRFDACSGCGGHDERGPTGQGITGCAFECGFLESSCQAALRSRVLVHEVSCRGSGAPACDFEVWY